MLGLRRSAAIGFLGLILAVQGCQCGHVARRSSGSARGVHVRAPFVDIHVPYDPADPVVRHEVDPSGTSDLERRN